MIVPEQALEEFGITHKSVTPDGVSTPQISTLLLDEGVVVVSKSTMDAPKRQSVRVTGTVRQFDRAVVGEDLPRVRTTVRRGQVRGGKMRV